MTWSYSFAFASRMAIRLGAEAYSAAFKSTEEWNSQSFAAIPEKHKSS
jgi:hypothetical protein